MSTELSNYEPIIESWVRSFYITMDSDPEVGDRSGDEPEGVKIIFAGYGYNEETDGYDDTSTMHFAVFVHKDSLTLYEFPEHNFQFGLIVHRPKEEVYINCYLDVEHDIFDYNPFENSEVDNGFFHQLICDIHARDNE